MVNETETDEAEEGRGRGQPEHERSDAIAAQVMALSQHGVPQTKIAALVGIGSKNTLVRHYRRELDLGDAQFCAMLGQTASRLALGAAAEYFPAGHQHAGKLAKAEVAPDKTLLIFFLKTRLGLRERIGIDLENIPDDDSNEFNTAGIPLSEVVTRIIGILDTARLRGDKSAAKGSSERAVGAVSREAARSGVQQRSPSPGLRGSGGGRQD